MKGRLVVGCHILPVNSKGELEPIRLLTQEVVGNFHPFKGETDVGDLFVVHDFLVTTNGYIGLVCLKSSVMPL